MVQGQAPREAAPTTDMGITRCARHQSRTPDARYASDGLHRVLAPPNTVGAVDVRGGAPATVETDLLRPDELVSTIHAVVLSGGSAFGLDAAAA